MPIRTKVDDKGRIIIPKHLRDALGIKSGDELIINIDKDKLVIQKDTDAFEVLRTVFKQLRFDRGLRRKAEEEALKEVGRELGD